MLLPLHAQLGLQAYAVIVGYFFNVNVGIKLNSHTFKSTILLSKPLLKFRHCVLMGMEFQICKVKMFWPPSIQHFVYI